MQIFSILVNEKCVHGMLTLYAIEKLIEIVYLMTAKFCSFRVLVRMGVVCYSRAGGEVG